MKLKNRFFRITTALAITGLVAAQIPSRPSVSLAADGYPGGSRALFSGGGAGTVIIGGAAAYALYTVVAGGKLTGGVGAPVPPAEDAGGTEKNGIGSNGGVGGGGTETVFEVTESKSDDFGSIAKIIENADATEKYSTESYTGLYPTNDALGTEKATSLQDPANKDEAKKFLASITVAGNYNIERLKEVASQGKSLKALNGDTIALKLEGDTLTANGVEVLANEYPASNGWVLATDGVVTSTDN
jgi:uncharacterized surface protein with fasciclin (FAS1) repeats